VSTRRHESRLAFLFLVRSALVLLGVVAYPFLFNFGN
jgi:hypothetical protein